MCSASCDTSETAEDYVCTCAETRRRADEAEIRIRAANVRYLAALTVYPNTED